MNARRLIIAYLIVLLAGLIAGDSMGRLPAGLSSRSGRLAHRRAHYLSAVGDLHLGPRLRRQHPQDAQ